MDKSKYYKFLSQDISILRGVGNKIKNLLKRKKIEKVSDLLWNLPQSFIDRSNLTSLDGLEIGKIATIKVKVVKYNIPRIKNLPNKVICEDEKGQIDIIFFNSRESYIKKILTINEWVIISGKVNFFRKNIDSFDKEELNELDFLLNIDDQVLYRWYLNQEIDTLIPVNDITIKLKKFRL